MSKVTVKTVRNQIIERDCDKLHPGDRVLHGSLKNNQRRIVMADTEEIRIHAENGGYLFSIRHLLGKTSMFFDTRFSGQSHEFEQEIQEYPWLKESK